LSHTHADAEELKILDNPGKEDLDSALRNLEEGYKKSLVYSSYIPRTVENLRFIIEWLRKKALEKRLDNKKG